MDLSLILPLETLTQIKITQTLIKRVTENVTIRDLINIMKGSAYLQKRIKEMVSVLPIPSLLKQKVINIMPPIEEDIREYLKGMSDLVDHHTFLKIALSKICFTFFGVVDYRKSAEMMLQDTKLTVCERYVIACNYCFEEEILHLKITYPRRELHSYLRASAVMRVWNDDRNVHFTQEGILLSRKDISHCKKAFYDSFRVSNLVAAEYFLRKLPLQHRRECYSEVLLFFKDFNGHPYAFTCHPYGKKILFLLTNFDRDFWENIKQNYCGIALACLTFWPYQDIFVKHATSLQKYITNELFEFFNALFVWNITFHKDDYDYLYLLKMMKNLYSETNKEDWINLFPSDEDLRKHITEMLK